MYPEMRELILEDNKEIDAKPDLDETVFEKFDERLRYALNFKKNLLVTYYRDHKLQECILFSFKIHENIIRCDNGRKIKLSEIVDLKIL